jgi:hypothetical protein
MTLYSLIEYSLKLLLHSSSKACQGELDALCLHGHDLDQIDTSYIERISIGYRSSSLVLK